MHTGDTNDSSSSHVVTGLPESLAGFLEMNFDAVVTFDARERITSWNPAAEQMFGWTAQEALGKTPAELFWPVSNPQEKKLQKQRQSKLKRGETLRGEQNASRKDGSFLWVQYAARAVFDADKKLTGYLAVYRGITSQVQDITERKRIEAQLERSNQKLNEILASIQDDFYVIDRDWMFVYANRQFASKLGKEPEDFVGNNVWKMFPKHVGTVLGENFRAAMEKRETRRFEMPGEYTDAWYKVTVFPSPEGITILGSEITEHKRLQAETESMSKFPQENPNPVLRVSHEGVVLFANRASQKLLDYWNCSIGTPLPDIWQEKVTERFRLGVSGETVLEWNGRIFLLQLVPILENHYLNIYGRDITERKRAEAQLERSNQKLNEILASIQDDFYVLDRDWMFVFASRSFTSKIGKEPGDFVGHNIWKMFPKHLGTTFEENLRAAMEKRETRRFEIRGKYTSAWYRMTVFPSPDGITVLRTDVTKRRQAEEALRRSEERLRQMIGTSPLAISFGDSTGRILEANESFYQLTGYSREEIQSLQLGWDQLTAPEYAEIDRQMMATLAATGAAGPYEKEYIRKDGSRVPLLLSVSKLPRRDEHVAFIMDMTERKRAEEAIRESQKRYQDLIETTSDFIWEMDSHGRYTYCSPQMEKLWGIKPEDMLGKTPFDVLPPEEKEGTQEYFREVISSAAPFTELTTITLNSQGQLFYVETSGVPFFDQDGRLLGFRGITRDVTERKHTRQQIFESNQRLLALMNALPVGVSFSDDPTSQYITGNPAVLAQFEIGSGDNLSASAPDSSAPGRQVQFFCDGRPITDADLPLQRAVAEDREIPPMEFEVRLPSGRQWWASGSGAPIRDQDGNVIGGVAVTQDITERKRREEQLRELSQRLTYHVDNSPLAVIEWGPDMRLVRWSGAAERMFGWKAEEVLGRRMEDLQWIYEEDTPQVSNVSVDLQTGSNPQRFSANRNYRKDGSVAYCEWYNSSLLDESGRLRSILSLVLDITERKRAEEALREHQKQLQLLNETLEQKVQEKTAEVHRLASDMIKAVQQERHRISHILHDDLQQRIYAIQMQLTLLQDELQNEAARQEASGIERQLAEVLEVTRHLSIDLSPPILRGEGLTQAINWLAAQMRQRYGLPIELQADGPFALYDEELQVLLFNCVRELLFNAVKHAQASRAVVALQWLEDGLQIEVRDDGRGFPANTLVQQANGGIDEGDTLPSSSGLPTIYHQLNLFGGRMEIQSEPGTGTRIFLTVPAAQAGE